MNCDTSVFINAKGAVSPRPYSAKPTILIAEGTPPVRSPAGNWEGHGKRHRDSNAILPFPAIGESSL